MKERERTRHAGRKSTLAESNGATGNWLCRDQLSVVRKKVTRMSLSHHLNSINYHVNYVKISVTKLNDCLRTMLGLQELRTVINPLDG
ncbi:hypothetical protein TNCV_112121 [Trichonephila clavipes]|nr:hypothetical protein TNCV_112121 [Trichonephila clavipes]